MGARETWRDLSTGVETVDAEWERRAWERLDSLTKPPRSLGRLEALAAQLAAVQRTDRPRSRPAAALIFAADHGVVSRGVSAYPQEVTGQMVRNFAAGGAAVNQLAGSAGAELVVYDVGVAAPLDDVAGIRHAKVRPGTQDMTAGPAMTAEEALRAVRIGIAAVEDLATRSGVRAVAIGEMGIGNTTAAAALISAFTGAAPREIVGPGTGLDAEGVARKASVVEEALAVNRSALEDPFATLAALGGLEIAAMAGAVLGCARHRVAAVIDGFISTAAALAATRICPACAGFVVASHRSKERGHAAALQALGVEPLLDLDMRLGEASGAVLALPLLDAACAVIGGMATFADAGVSEATSR
ncbi:MAG: nicotinate-nucleotide--dimethylbenzimidazole phosphoribosyltransferase [Anaerosomatales bacterium]|nr:nicotinate-nucleotide--dimethylbenzimidazole phosphoribosyltransferase [Anaerosomatales bacterium]